MLVVFIIFLIIAVRLFTIQIVDKQYSLMIINSDLSMSLMDIKHLAHSIIQIMPESS